MNPETKRDLGRYAEEKLFRYLKDVVQSFEIADASTGQAMACVSALFMRSAATIAVGRGISRTRWFELCTQVYDLAEKENDR